MAVTRAHVPVIAAYSVNLVVRVRRIMMKTFFLLILAIVVLAFGGIDELAITDEDVAAFWDELQDVPSYAERYAHPEMVAVPVVVMEDEPLHTTERPYCALESCSCHEDETLFEEYIVSPVMDGLMTPWEAVRLRWGETF
jgi:hypothetical protein